jgi:hypothetical protein
MFFLEFFVKGIPNNVDMLLGDYYPQTSILPGFYRILLCWDWFSTVLCGVKFVYIFMTLPHIIQDLILQFTVIEI